MPRTVNFAEWRDRKNEDGKVVIELPDGDPVVVPPPILWPTPNEGETNEAFTRRIVGEDAWERFVAAGGTWAMLNAILTGQNGADPGE